MRLFHLYGKLQDESPSCAVQRLATCYHIACTPRRSTTLYGAITALAGLTPVLPCTTTALKAAT